MIMINSQAKVTLKSVIMMPNLATVEIVNVLKDIAIALLLVSIAKLNVNAKSVTISQSTKMNAKRPFKRRRNVLKMPSNPLSLTIHTSKDVTARTLTAKKDIVYAIKMVYFAAVFANVLNVKIKLRLWRKKYLFLTIIPLNPPPNTYNSPLTILKWFLHHQCNNKWLKIQSIIIYLLSSISNHHTIKTHSIKITLMLNFLQLSKKILLETKVNRLKRISVLWKNPENVNHLNQMKNKKPFRSLTRFLLLTTSM